MHEVEIHFDSTYTHTQHNRFTALWNLSGKTRLSRYQKKHSPTTLTAVINHPYQPPPSSTILLIWLYMLGQTCFKRYTKLY